MRHTTYFGGCRFGHIFLFTKVILCSTVVQDVAVRMYSHPLDQCNRYQSPRQRSRHDY